jgi:hypothetical protein
MKNTILIYLFVFIGTALQAQTGFRNQSVSVFKNATAFMVKSGTVQMTDNAWLWQSDSLPAMLAGTFWAGAPENSLLAVKSMLEEKKETTVMRTFAEMLDINDGKRVRLHFNSDSTKWEGTIRLTRQGNQTSNLYALKTTAGGIVFFAPSEIANLRRVEFLEEPNVIKSVSNVTPTLRFEFKNNRPNQVLGLMYLQKNIAWNPEYKLELLDDQKATLSMWATVTNEAENFDTEELNLVAGLPNFKNATEIHRFLKQLFANSPALKATAATHSNPATHSNLSNYSNYSNVSTGSVYTENIPVEPSSNEDLTTSTVGDMYYYTLKNVRLNRGERAIYNVFEAKISIAHIYRTNIPTNSSGYTETYSSARGTHNVDHSLLLKNNSNYPWTAGSIFITSNTNGKTSPISQDALYYTAQQQNREIYLTQSPDIIVRSSESQKNRKKDDMKITAGNYDVFYDLVTVNAEIEVQNFKNTPIQLDIKRTVVGELIATSNDWQATRLTINQRNQNGSNQVLWNVKMNAGEKKTITYSYKMYVEHRRAARQK